MLKNTEEERYQKFLKGTFLIKGWNARAEEILEAAPPGDRDELQSLLSKLGEKIGREWAKDLKVRKIDTAMLQKWGKQLKEANDSSADEMADSLRKIDREADTILSS